MTWTYYPVASCDESRKSGSDFSEVREGWEATGRTDKINDGILWVTALLCYSKAE